MKSAIAWTRVKKPKLNQDCKSSRLFHQRVQSSRKPKESMQSRRFQTTERIQRIQTAESNKSLKTQTKPVLSTKQAKLSKPSEWAQRVHAIEARKHQQKVLNRKSFYTLVRGKWLSNPPRYRQPETLKMHCVSTIQTKMKFPRMHIALETPKGNKMKCGLKIERFTAQNQQAIESWQGS